ncbi:hypothetical protein [Nocardioides sp.]|uniref:hypothetical protein n=1 Tax=Nocardioides sp. TaxID=35761 RepID=UPI00356B5E1B
MRNSETKDELGQESTRKPKRYARVLLATVLLAAGILFASCSSDSSQTTADDSTPSATVVVDDAEADTDTDTEVESDVAADTLLATGPQNVGEHGPFSNADFDRDGAVTRAELDQFMDGALEREIGLVAFFDLYDSDGNDVLDSDELATVDPAFAFDGTDANADGSVSLTEVTDYANEDGRSYRAMGLGVFFDLVDTDDDDVVSAAEIEVAHESGLLARF